MSGKYVFLGFIFWPKKVFLAHNSSAHFFSFTICSSPLHVESFLTCSCTLDQLLDHLNSLQSDWHPGLWHFNNVITFTFTAHLLKITIIHLCSVNFLPCCQLHQGKALKMEAVTAEKDPKKALHNRKKLHSCKVCQYSTTYSTNLKQHMRKHTREKPFKCNQCSYSCTTDHSLQIHMLSADTLWWKNLSNAYSVTTPSQ